MKMEFRPLDGRSRMTLGDFEKVIATIRANGGNPDDIIPRIRITIGSRPKMVEAVWERHIEPEPTNLSPNDPVWGIR